MRRNGSASMPIIPMFKAMGIILLVVVVVVDFSSVGALFSSRIFEMLNCYLLGNCVGNLNLSSDFENYEKKKWL
jgi:hypothetical protein